MKQKDGENVQHFAELLIIISEDAYPGEDADSVHMQKQLVETFTDGVKDNAIIRRLLRLRPDS